MKDVASISRPQLTMPELEANVVRQAYAEANVILEYGSGGSTVLAAEMPGKRVFSVESDKAWVKMMRGWLEQNPAAEGTEIDLIWCDIGKTRKWGYPKDHDGWERYARYPLEVWDSPGFQHPDVVLVDGRFRTGCAMAAAFRSTRPVTVLVDDYENRKQYHRLESYIGAPQLRGRLAKFNVTPMPVPADRLLDIIGMMTRP